MKTRRHHMLTLCCLQIALFACGSFAHAAELLFVSEYHAGDISPKTGQVWHGLFNGRKGCILRTAKISVKIVNDPIMDIDTKKNTGKQVVVDKPGEVLFLVREWDASTRYDVSSRTLWVSGGAAPSQLVRAIAKLEVSGC